MNKSQVTSMGHNPTYITQLLALLEQEIFQGCQPLQPPPHPPTFLPSPLKPQPDIVSLHPTGPSLVPTIAPIHTLSFELCATTKYFNFMYKVRNGL